jgi:TRAP-type transport system periplasmic protein
MGAVYRGHQLTAVSHQLSVMQAGSRKLEHNAPMAGAHSIGRRGFLTGFGAGALAAACRSRPAARPLVLRLSHSMSAGMTALHVFGDKFRELAEAATAGAVTVRVFPSGTLGQEREVVQQLQEGLIDFMVSGTAIWGSVAPRLQAFDFPFLWRDWAHVHRVVDGPTGREAADYLDAAVHIRPIAWGDSFGFRQVITRSRDVTEAGQLTGLKIRTIQSQIYVKAVQLMGGSPTPMAFGEVYTSLQTGVIDGYEHDASTTYQQHFFEVARYMARTRHIAGVLGLFASTRGLARLPADIRTAVERAAIEAARTQRAMGPAEDIEAARELTARGMTIRDIDNTPFRQPAERLWESEARELGVGSWLQAIRE